MERKVTTHEEIKKNKLEAYKNHKRFNGILYDYPEDPEYEVQLAHDITETLEYMKRNAETMSLTELSGLYISMCDMVADLEATCANDCDAACEWGAGECRRFRDLYMDSRVVLV